MGVSLERVQFKFASIIGELCSEPDVLSQFAVWLDLRLAEYKLKGNISLDCSGLEPDPVWLKGLNKGKKNIQESGNNQASTASNQSIGSDNTERLTFDDSDMGQDVYTCSVETSTSQSSPRKRSASKRASQTTPRSTPKVKQRRLSPANDSADNQSLMSVIGSYQDDSRVSVSKDDDSAHMDDISQLHVQHVEIQGADNSQMSEVGSGQESVNAYGDMEIWVEDSNMIEGRQPDSSFSAHAQSSAKVPRYTQMPCQEARRNRIKRIDEIPKKSVMNMVNAATTFERWLWMQSTNDTRSVCDIPPDQLDCYLADFFSVIKRDSGDEYKVDSFLSLRSHLERYLKESGYPASITNSFHFSKSQVSFKIKSLQLARAQSLVKLDGMGSGEDNF